MVMGRAVALVFGGNGLLCFCGLHGWVLKKVGRLKLCGRREGQLQMKWAVEVVGMWQLQFAEKKRDRLALLPFK
ncbi:hypothetical protein Droror1_Dr00018553, partial [Drosera rotundifolia]